MEDSALVGISVLHRVGGKGKVSRSGLCSQSKVYWLLGVNLNAR